MLQSNLKQIDFDQLFQDNIDIDSLSTMGDEACYLAAVAVLEPYLGKKISSSKIGSENGRQLSVGIILTYLVLGQKVMKS